VTYPRTSLRRRSGKIIGKVREKKQGKGCGKVRGKACGVLHSRGSGRRRDQGSSLYYARLEARIGGGRGIAKRGPGRERE